MGDYAEVKNRLDAFNHWYELNGGHKSSELLDLEVAGKEITRLQAALEDMFAMLDEGILVRDITNDASDTFTMDMLAFVQRLAACKQALKGQDDV